MDKEPGQRIFEKARSFRYPPMDIDDAWAILEPWEKEYWANEQAAIEVPHLAEIERLKAKVVDLEADRLPLVERCVDAMMNGKLCGKHRAEWIKLVERVGPRAISEILDHCDGCVREERDQLRTKAAELEKERDGIVAKLGEAIKLAGTMLYGSEKGLSDTEAALRLHALQTYHASLGQEPPPELPAPERDRPLRVYIAGGSSERMLVQGWIDEIVRKGVVVTCDWTRDPGWSLGRTQTSEELAEAAVRDIAGIDAADLVWRIIPVTPSEGSADEGGYARGRGKRIVVSGTIGPRNVFELLPGVTRFATHEEAAAHIVSLAKAMETSK